MLKIATILLTVMLVFAAVYSFMGIFAAKLIVGSSFEAITGKSIDSIADAGYKKALLNTQRYLGAFALATTISGSFILFAAFVKKLKWSWPAILFIGGIAWGWGLISNLLIGDTLNIILQCVGTGLFLIGLLLPIKEFFTEN
jgi:hypothetical protein